MVESTASGSRPNVQTTDVEFAGVHGVRASEQDTESPTCRIVQLGEKVDRISVSLDMILPVDQRQSSNR